MHPFESAWLRFALLALCFVPMAIPAFVHTGEFTTQALCFVSGALFGGYAISLRKTRAGQPRPNQSE